MDIMQASASTTSKMIYHTKQTLKNTLKNKYNIDDENKVDEILKIHGLHRENFDFITNAEQIIKSKLNDVSIDANANKSEKGIEVINQEVVTSVKKALGFDYLFKSMVELYGKEEANRLLGEMLDYSLGIHDSSNLLRAYCWSMDTSDLIFSGRNFGHLHYKPAQTLSDYIMMVCEQIHVIEAHIAGAVALPSIMADVAFILMSKENTTLDQIKENKDTKHYILSEFQQLIYSVNNLSRNSTETPFTNISIFDRVKLKALISDKSWMFENFAIDYVIEYVIEIQNIFLELFDAGDPNMNGAPLRFPVVTVNFGLSKNNNISDTKFLSDICKREIYRYNIFVSEGTKVASCCRLVNDSEMMKDFASAANSFGGSGISIGSHRVITINFMRIALEAKTKEEFYDILENRIESSAKILKAHKDLIVALEKMGLQPFITNGTVNIKRLFSTFGVMGLYEAVEVYKEKFGNGEDIQGNILTYMNELVKEMSDKYKFIGNIECVPGESFAARLARTDKTIFGDNKVPYTMYSNQFVPLWENATLWERLEKDGKYNKLITGGGIVHAQIGEKVSPKQAEQIIKFAIKSGCEHFALNSVWSKCSNNHLNFGKYEKCPQCEAKIVDYFTRIVGYFTPVSNWSKGRREWEFPKRTFVTLDEIKESK